MPAAPKIDPPSPAPDPAIADPEMVVDETKPDGARRRTYRSTAPKAARSMQVIALLFVGLITAGCIVALGYAMVVSGSATAEQSIGTIALIGVGSLTTLLGYKAGASGSSSTTGKE